MSNAQEHETSKSANLDLTGATNTLWLLKVPKYISEKWEESPDGAGVAALRIDRSSTENPVVSLSLPPEVANKNPKGQIPTEHILNTMPMTSQTLGVFTHDAIAGTSGTIKMNGIIVEKLQCAPLDANCDMERKQYSLRHGLQSQRKTELLANRPRENEVGLIVHNVNSGYSPEEEKLLSCEQLAKAKLLRAFEFRPYFKFKELLPIVGVSSSILREILREICDFHKRDPHRNMYGLKPNYQSKDS